jgi:predicted nucleic acid-binding protein
LREFVLDCSAVLSWLFPDEGDPYGTALIEVVGDSRMYVPSLLWLEAANAFLIAERKGRLTVADTARMAAILEAMPTTTDTDPSESRFPEVMSLGRRYGLSAYDATYLDLALRRGLPIATLDSALMNAAQAAGVGVFQP